MDTRTQRPTLLIVDDDALIRDSLRLALADSFDMTLAENRAQAIQQLREMPQSPDLALVDLGLPPTPHRPEEGFRLIAALLNHAPTIRIIALSGQDDESNARHARALGAVDFIAKPCAPASIKAQLNNALLLPSADAGSEGDGQLGIIGQSAPIEAMRSQIVLYASTPYPVLIEGESGSGKELVAAALQRLSPNSKAPFIVFNCAAISPQLVEAALFGHAKGAYTGASQAQNGFFEDAGDGILFLDEIGELPIELQAKLLRVLENGEFQRVGETATRKSRARIIAATNRDLRQAVRESRFRLDLYHRLSVFTIHVPPLRELGADKLRQLDYFRTHFAAQISRPPFQLETAASVLWEQYDFPGNTRELRNICIRLATKYPGQTVSASQLEAELDLGGGIAPCQQNDALSQARQDLQQNATFSLDELLMRVSGHYIDAAMELSHGNVSEAAKLLGMNRTTLYSRMDSLQKFKLGKSREGSQ